METSKFIDAVESLGLSKSDVARLLGVTLRSVDFWWSGSREVPGPVSAYIRLLSALPAAIQAQELSRLKDNPMKMDGMYLVQFTGRDGPGLAVITLMDGIVFGSDGGVLYDGTYAPSLNAGKIDLFLKLTVPKGVSLVTGVPEQPAEYSFTLELTILARGSVSNMKIDTPYSPVLCDIRFLRPLPDQLAA